MTVEQVFSFDRAMSHIEALCKAVRDKKIKDVVPGAEFCRQVAVLKKMFKDMCERRAGDGEYIEKNIHIFRWTLEKELLKRVPKKDPQKTAWNEYIRDLQTCLEEFCDLLIAVESDLEGCSDGGGDAADGGGEAGATDGVETDDEPSVRLSDEPLYNFDDLTEKTRVCLEALENFLKKIASEMLRKKCLCLARFTELKKIKNWAQELSIVLGDSRRWAEGYDHGVMEYFTGFTRDTSALEGLVLGKGLNAFDEALSAVFDLDERRFLAFLDELEATLPVSAFEDEESCDAKGSDVQEATSVVTVQVPFLAAPGLLEHVAGDSVRLSASKKRGKKEKRKSLLVHLGKVIHRFLLMKEEFRHLNCQLV